MEKKKIFVVVIDEVRDMASYSNKPFAYDTEDKAKAKINELHEQILSELGAISRTMIGLTRARKMLMSSYMLTAEAVRIIIQQ